MAGLGTSTNFDSEIHMDLPLREDIGAELDEFLLLALLGIDDEAYAAAKVVLWRHLRWFPVMAEIAGFAIERNDMELLRCLLDTLHAEKIEFEGDDESLFLQTVTSISKNSLLSLEGVNWWLPSTSPVLQHVFEFSMISALRLTSGGEYLSYSGRLRTEFREFCDHGMYAEAVRTFSILYSMAPAREQVDKWLNSVFTDDFEKSLSTLSDDPRQPQQKTKDEQKEVYTLMLRLSCLKFVSLNIDSLKYSYWSLDLNDCLTETKSLLEKAFASLPDPSPRGNHWELFEQLEESLKSEDHRHLFISPPPIIIGESGVAQLGGSYFRNREEFSQNLTFSKNSRDSCVPCTRRRIKCTLEKPICRNCERVGLICELPKESSSSDSRETFSESFTKPGSISDLGDEMVYPPRFIPDESLQSKLNSRLAKSKRSRESRTTPTTVLDD